MNLDIPAHKSRLILEASTLPFDIGDDAQPSKDSKDDPIAAQVWKMYSKQRKELPNGARMENLTWRMVRPVSPSSMLTC